MKTNGENLIKIICEKLSADDIRTYDSEIVRKLREMTHIELQQAIIFGDVSKWHNERIKEDSQKHL